MEAWFPHTHLWVYSPLSFAALYFGKVNLLQAGMSTGNCTITSDGVYAQVAAITAIAMVAT